MEKLLHTGPAPTTAIAPDASIDLMKLWLVASLRSCSAPSLISHVSTQGAPKATILLAHLLLPLKRQRAPGEDGRQLEWQSRRFLKKRWAGSVLSSWLASADKVSRKGDEGEIGGPVEGDEEDIGNDLSCSFCKGVLTPEPLPIGIFTRRPVSLVTERVPFSQARRQRESAMVVGRHVV